MRRQLVPHRARLAGARVLCLGVVVSIGLAGVVAWAPHTMKGGAAGAAVERSAWIGLPEALASSGPVNGGAIAPEMAEKAANAALTSRVGGVGSVGPGVLGIPAPLLTAYRRAATSLGQADPGCHLQWWVLAGIGKIESNHARGGRVDTRGRTNGEILGPRLDGSLANTAVITDSDDGRLDGDAAYDRAVGPMQFLPGTWNGWASDGNGDGRRDPHNIYDATLAAGRYLCAGSTDLSTGAGLAKAILRYNPSGPYLRSVLGWAASYRDGGRSVPAERGPVFGGPEPPPRGSLPPGTRPPGDIDDLPSNDPPGRPGTPSPTPDPSGPSPTPTPTSTPKPPPKPSPTPTKPKPTSPSPQPPDTPSPTPTPTETPSPTPTPTPTPSPTGSPCADPTPSPTGSPSPTPTPTPSPTGSPCPTPSPGDGATSPAQKPAAG